MLNKLVDLRNKCLLCGAAGWRGGLGLCVLVHFFHSRTVWLSCEVHDFCWSLHNTQATPSATTATFGRRRADSTVYEPRLHLVVPFVTCCSLCCRRLLDNYDYFGKAAEARTGVQLSESRGAPAAAARRPCCCKTPLPLLQGTPAAAVRSRL